MIYLFEDRKERMNILLKGNALDKNFIQTGINIDCRKDELFNFFNNLDNLEGVIIHSSYKFVNNITLSDVEDIVKNKLNKFIVKFSGGANNAVINEFNEVVVNSGDFYNNINIFIEYYQKNAQYNLPLLVFGNIGYQKHQLKQFQDIAIKRIIEKENIDKQTIKHLLNHLNGYVKSKDLQDRKNILEHWLKDFLTPDNKQIEPETLICQILRFSQL